MTARGSVSDYSDTSSLQQKVATAAGVERSLVTITVADTSVIITATIVVPASTTAATMQTSLVTTLGTVPAASTALGITVESVPTVTIGGTLKETSETSESEGLAAPVIAGIAVGAALGIVAIIVVSVIAMKRPRKRADAAVVRQYHNKPNEVEIAQVKM